MNKGLLALLLAGGMVIGATGPNPESNGAAQTTPQTDQAPAKVAAKQFPAGCDCKDCDCEVRMGAPCDGNCGPTIKQQVSQPPAPDAKFTPQKQLSYDEAYTQVMNTGGILAVYKGPWAYSQLKNVASCYVSSADPRFAEYPERCVIVSRAEKGDDGVMHLNYVTTVVDGRPESILRAFTLPTPTYDRAVTQPQLTTMRAPIGHTHTCPRCGITWDHAMNAGHNCPNCGTQQLYQDMIPKTVMVRNQPLVAVRLQATSGGCANGSCGSSRGLFR